jgi:hypothetical protein
MRRLVIALTLLAAVPALAHDSAHPENNQWLKNLGSPRGVCCDGSEALRVDDPDWVEAENGHAPDGSECRKNLPHGGFGSTDTGHYCVRLIVYPNDGVLSEKAWFLVTDDALVEGNKDGFARVWPITRSIDGGKIEVEGIRCFLKGTLS